MFMVYTYIEDQKVQLISKFGTDVAVVVAKKDIGELELIDETKITLITVPQTFAQPGSFNSIKDLETTVATVPILKGEQVTKPRVTYPGAKTGLSRQVSVEKRAFAIQITERQAVSRLIKPGDRVDVISAIDYSSGRKDMQKTKTILQDVLVLSTGMSMTNSIPLYGQKIDEAVKVMNLSTYSNYNTVTLELDPYQVQKLVFLIAFTGQQPFLSLRNNNDKKIVPIRATDIFDVIGEEDRGEAKNFFADKYKEQQASQRGGR
jgi:pilus assembly protein CpaB